MTDVQEFKDGKWVEATPLKCPSWWACKWEAICDAIKSINKRQGDDK